MSGAVVVRIGVHPIDQSFPGDMIRELTRKQAFVRMRQNPLGELS